MFGVEIAWGTYGFDGELWVAMVNFWRLMVKFAG